MPFWGGVGDVMSRPSGHGARRQRGDDQPSEPRRNLYDEVTARIIAELGEGRVPWVQPWGKAGSAGPCLPRNALSRRLYSGVNVLILWGEVIQHGCPRNRG